MPANHRGPATRLSALSALAFAAAIWGPTSVSAQGAAEFLRGKVLSQDSLPVTGALVAATNNATQQTETTTTKSDGSFSLLMRDGEGSYFVVVRAIGYTPVGSRETRTGASPVISFNIVLTRAAVQLDSILTTVSKSFANNIDRPPVGGVERNALLVAPFTLDPGNLQLLAAMLPGMVGMGDSGYSVLGMAPDKNSTTVDGMPFNGDGLPRDAIGTAKVATSSYDPAKGDFSGAQLAVRSLAGSNTFYWTMRGQHQDRNASWVDPLTPTAPSDITSVSGSLGGPIRRNQTYYLLAWDAMDRLTAATSLLSPRAGQLSRDGILPDTVATLLATLDTLGIPTALNSSADQHTRSGRLSLRLDASLSAATSLTLLANGSWQRSTGSGRSVLALPTIANQSNTSSQRIYLKGSQSLPIGLDELSISWERNGTSLSPGLSFPSGVVQVGASYPDARTGFTSLRFGGGAQGISSSTTSTSQFANELFFLGLSTHQLKFGQQMRWTGTTLNSEASQGTWRYQSLVDLAANQPLSYSRTIFATTRNTAGLVGALWAGDEWQATPRLQIQGGIRADFTRASTLPSYNPEVDSVFARRTDRIPSGIAFSPRLGFSWTLHAVEDRMEFIGTKTTHTTVNGNRARGFVSRTSGPERALGTGLGLVLRGGIGAFYQPLSPARISALQATTGLPGTQQLLSCVGDATPIPNWQEPDSLQPSLCLDNTTSVPFGITRPQVSLLDPGFESSVAWRANLGLSGLRWKGWALAPSMMYSIEPHLESWVDLNLRRTPQFTLDAESGRPVYAAENDILPGSGAIAPGAARVSSLFGQVRSVTSDLQSRAFQFRFELSPPSDVNFWFPFTLTYTYTSQRLDQRGFGGFGGGSTAGDPFAVEHVGGNQPEHQIQWNGKHRIWWFQAGVRATVMSGWRYTPMVAGDINGDGLSNDRAFISDPAKPTALGADLTALLARAPASAVSCLRAQIGRVAKANSCSTGWQTQLDINLLFNPPPAFGLSKNLKIVATVVNGGNALIRLAGLADTPLGRNQSTPRPDSRLLYVTGFDPTARQFQYRVNQLFGEPLAVGAQTRNALPLQLVIGAEYRLGGAPGNGFARQLDLLPHGTTPLTEDDIRQRLRRLFEDPVTMVMALRDSLQLTTEQVAQIDSIGVFFRLKMERSFGGIVRLVLQRGSDLPDTEFIMPFSQLQLQGPRNVADTKAEIQGILTAEQRFKLRSWAGND